MAAGSTVVAYKEALLALLTTRTGATVNVGYQAPEDKADLQNTAGLQEAVWFEDADGTDDVVALGTPLILDETYTVKVVVQVLNPASDGTQRAVDARAVAILGEVIGLVSANPTLSVTAFARCETVSLGWKHVVGRLGTQPGHGSRFEISLGVEARLNLT